ncbi:MAG: hypothetical protein ACRDQA_21165, partial [Nocardioidaceae bacterium]
PPWLGCWPASLLLLAFVWLELANPSYSQDLTVVRWWFLAVGVTALVGAVVYGDSWFERADPFEVYSDLVARLSPFGRRSDGTLVIRNPLENLDGLAPMPGLPAVVAVLFGSTCFDSFKDSQHWLQLSLAHPDHASLLNTAGLLGFCVVVFGTFLLASAATAGVGQTVRRGLPGQLAHSIVPIIVGYIVAHYLTFFVSVGIGTMQELGDPLSRGWQWSSWLAGLNKYAIFEHPTAIAVTKVVAVVVGHVLGVVAAHDRAVKLLPRRHVVTGQLPLLALMVGYTLTGLWLLFSA